MPIVYVDADACPRPVKEVLFRISDRIGLEVVLVANQRLRVPEQGRVRSVQVERGFDVADAWIAERAGPGDLVIADDIQVQVDVLEAGAQVIDFKGEPVGLATARSRLTLKDLLEDLRQAGEIGGGPKGRKARDTKRFAEALDRWVEANLRR
jgi:uncharacterized protein